MAVKQLSDGNPSGTSLGQSSDDLVSLYNETPVAQASAIASPASSLGSVKSKVISILTALRNLGVIAT